MRNNHPVGLVVSRSEAEAAQRVIDGAHKAGYMDAVTWAEMTTDLASRTVPVA